jgi:hypothetical protein
MNLSIQAKHDLDHLRRNMNRGKALAVISALIKDLDDDTREQVEAVPFEALTSTIDEALAKREWISRSHHFDHPLRPKVSVEEGPSSYGRRYFIKGECGETVIEHDIASDPAITSNERLQAHLNSTLEVVLREAQQESKPVAPVTPVTPVTPTASTALALSTLDRASLEAAVKQAKREADADFFGGGCQILAVDADGERVTGDPVSEHASAAPPIRLLKQLAYEYGIPRRGRFDRPEDIAVELIVEGQGYYFAEFNGKRWGNAVERREHGEPSGDWWQVSIRLDR